MGIGAGRIAIAAAAAISAWLPADIARAANGAYAVDAADISEVGSCKIESWLSAATNTDFSAVANPSCAVNIFRPVELSLQTVRSRSDGDWSTTIAPKAKWNFVPTGIGKFGMSFYAAGSFDATTGENLSAFAVVPLTYRLSENMRINLNGGWLWDRMAARHYLVYGAGVDWKFTETLQWTIEAFGQAGAELTKLVTIEKGLGPDGRIAVVRFDRGDGINALSPEAMRQLTDAARSFEDDGETSVVVLTGAAKAFTAGFDLKDPEGRARKNMDLGALRRSLKVGPRLTR